MPVVNFKIAPNDKETIGMAIDVDGQEVARTALNAEHIDSLIQALGHHRASLLPPQPPQPDPTKLPTLAVQAYGFADQKMKDGPDLLVIQHPMFGWLGFTFADAAAKELAERFSGQKADPAKKPKVK